MGCRAPEVPTLSAVEMAHPHDVAILVGAWCYLRPAELLALERGDVGDGILNVRGTKTARSRRTVPPPLRASQALAELPPRLRQPTSVPEPTGRLLRRVQLAPPRVRLGQGCGRLGERGHAVHAPALGDLVGAPRRDPG